MLVTYVVVLAFQLYMMYLNIKQSRVNNQMDILIKEIKGVRQDLKSLASSKKGKV